MAKNIIVVGKNTGQRLDCRAEEQERYRAGPEIWALWDVALTKQAFVTKVVLAFEACTGLRRLAYIDESLKLSKCGALPEDGIALILPSHLLETEWLTYSPLPCVRGD